MFRTTTAGHHLLLVVIKQEMVAPMALMGRRFCLSKITLVLPEIFHVLHRRLGILKVPKSSHMRPMYMGLTEWEVYTVPNDRSYPHTFTKLWPAYSIRPILYEEFPASKRICSWGRITIVPNGDALFHPAAGYSFESYSKSPAFSPHGDRERVSPA